MSPHGIMTASLAPRSRLRAAASVPGNSISAAAPVDTGNFIRLAFAHQCDDFNYFGVDSGLWVDWVDYSAPKSPRSPNPPRSFTAHGALGERGAAGEHGAHPVGGWRRSVLARGSAAGCGRCGGD